MRWLRRIRRGRRTRVRTQKERAHYELHKESARKLVHERIEHWRTFLPVAHGRVSIKDHRSRWGSCSSKKNLNFNYRLAFIPVELVDYVVVHELCHLVEFNHSPNFWSKVEELLPDYELRKKALGTYTVILTTSGTRGGTPAVHLTQEQIQVS
jgi:predicted metal-dependent hydrolase